MCKVWEFVITGGPSAGKTTALSRLERVFSDKGYKVIIMPEVATQVILSGFNSKELSVDDFQRVIIERGINSEETLRKVVNKFKKDVVVFYDRGILDSKAYMSNESFVRILKENGLSEITVRDSYDAVFHLVTAAIGAENAYTTENNKARMENVEQAREKDKKTRDAWIGHSHMRVIDNSTGFKEKIDRLIKEVFAVMGVPVPVEIERKFLIKRPTIEQLQINECVKSQIVQTYLKRNDPEVERRIRQRGIDGNFTYYYTEKKVKTSISRDEVERRISKDEYISLLTEGIAAIRKERYCFFYENQYFELDIYPDWENEAILEIELTQENQEIKFPDWITVIKEVTGDPKYKNANLAK
ncbi:MAG: AAA family ATPase [Clostridia bacterium]|nr:AAA family ATPase [Clostridia bacterium]